MSAFNESIVLVGGGGGVYRVAKFLTHVRPNITTVQTVFDHGGHSGVLRDERGVLPPGDIRQAILALSEAHSDPALRALMAYRFCEKGNSSLNGNTVGNIILTALIEITGSMPAAVKSYSRISGARGTVLPVSPDDAELCVKLSDGSILKGEGNIDTRSIDDDRTIVRAFLEPNAHIFVDTYQSVVKADKIVFCPGDIYTSLVPNLLVDGFTEALAETTGKIVYVVNIMTKKAETDRFQVHDFVRVVHSYISRKIDYVVYNDSKLSQPVIDAYYEKEKSRPVVFTKEDLSIASHWVPAPLSDESGGIVRHHESIASVIADL